MRQGFEKLGLSDQPTTQSQRMNIHTNARLTLRSREALVSAIINRKLTAQEAAAAFLRSKRTHGPQMGRPLSHRGSRWAARSLLAPTPQPPSDPTSPSRSRVVTAPAAHARLSNRTPDHPFQSERLAHPASPSTPPPRSARSTSASTPLRTPTARRAHPPGHQKARPHRAPKPPRHRQPPRPGQRRGLGICPRRH